MDEAGHKGLGACLYIPPAAVSKTKGVTDLSVECIVHDATQYAGRHILAPMEGRCGQRRSTTRCN